MNKVIVNARIAQLKAMHELMLTANDESIYMTWIYYVPDEPSESDFEDIAESVEDFNECVAIFKKLVKYEDFWC